MTGWDAEVFLLKVDVAWPLSIDSKIWPSAFDELGYSDFPENAIRPSIGSWFDLHVMLDFLKSPKMDKINRGVPICVELVTDRPLPLDDFWDSVISPYSQLSSDGTPGGWILLGYDIADSYQLSGLMNCGYDPNEIADLRLTWKDRLNEHGLFRSPEDAIRFKETVDLRAREHAPFYVYALYRDPLLWERESVRK
jgi:hypothetical protein